jgi:hypothetical protein
MEARMQRKTFIDGLGFGLRVVWPVLSMLIAAMVALGVTIGWLEGWSIQDSIYFAFVSGLTIGYGDLVPTRLATRAMAIAIGLCGILLTALLAAIAVKALASIREE